MSTRGQATAKRRSTNGSEAQQHPKSLDIANHGISTSRDFRDFMSALMSDVISGAVTANVTNAACNAGGKMLKMVELEYKYATKPSRVHPTLTVAFESTELQAEEPIAQLAASE